MSNNSYLEVIDPFLVFRLYFTENQLLNLEKL